jgi:hypothetical protein
MGFQFVLEYYAFGKCCMTFLMVNNPSEETEGAYEVVEGE